MSCVSDSYLLKLYLGFVSLLYSYLSYSVQFNELYPD